MTNFDPAWVALGLFFLACGGVPAIAALIAEGRGQPSRPPVQAGVSYGFNLRLFHEEPGGTTPVDLARIGHAVARPRWVLVHPDIVGRE
jgi:hypothetical protein